MVRSAFSFRGVANRRDFALGFAVQFALLMIVGTVIFVAAALGLIGLREAGVMPRGLSDALYDQAIPMTTIVVGIPFIIAQLALVARRARDMGVSPLLVLLLWLAAIVADSFVFQARLDARFLWPMDNMTPLGGAICAILLIVHFLAPSSPRLRRDVEAQDVKGLAQVKAVFD